MPGGLKIRATRRASVQVSGTSILGQAPRNVTLRRKLGGLFELQGEGNRILAMEGLRGVAVLLVFWAHFQSLFGELLPAGPGWRGVAEWMKQF